MEKKLPLIDYRAIFEQTSSPYLLLAPDMPVYTIIDASDSYLKATMTKREQILGRSLFEIFPDNPDDPGATGVRNLRESLGRVIRYRKADSMAVQKYDVKSPDGTFEERWWNPTNSPVMSSDGSIGYIIHHVEDVTEFIKQYRGEIREETVPVGKEMEKTGAEIYVKGQRLQEANEKLRIARNAYRALYCDCIKLTRNLRRSNKDLEQFTYFASHDLQGPILAVSGFLSHLKSVYGSSLNEDALDDINEAVSGAQRMQELIQDLLTFSKLSSVKGASFKPVDMNSVVDEAVENLISLIQESGAVIEKEKLPIVIADKTQMVLLFQNLINNAIKYRSARNPQVRIRAVSNESKWVFAIEDKGIGIDPKYFNTIFQMFQRLFTREEYPGTGIGLAVCKRIVERHHGNIWVESKPGEGTTFFFSIPE